MKAKKNKEVNARVPAKALSHKEQRKIWQAKGLCDVDGKEPVWNVKQDTETKFGVVRAGKKSECKEHFLYFKEKAFEARTKNAKPVRKTKAATAKEGNMSSDMIDLITRNVAQKIGGGSTVQLHPMDRGEFFNAIRTGVQNATRQIGFRPHSKS